MTGAVAWTCVTAGMPDGPASIANRRERRADPFPALSVPHQERTTALMALYEHMLIARQDISAQAVDALATHLKTIVENEGGKVEKQEYWGLRTLAFRIKKNRKG